MGSSHEAQSEIDTFGRLPDVLQSRKAPVMAECSSHPASAAPFSSDFTPIVRDFIWYVRVKASLNPQQSLGQLLA